MILPVHVLITTLHDLSLPVYIDDSGHKCHFKDVVIALSKNALVKEKFMEEDIGEDLMLMHEW